MRLALPLALMAALTAPLEARAQEEYREPASRKLGGHTFMYPASISSAFIDTFFGTRTTARSEQVSDLPLGSRLVDVNSIGLAQNVDFELALTEKFSVGVGVFGRAVSGTSGRSFAAAGVRYSYGVLLDAALRIARFEQSGTQFALRAEVFGIQGGGQISLVPFIQAIRSDQPREVPEILLNFGSLLVTPVSRLGGTASLNLAQAIGKVFSIQTSFRLELRRTVQSPYVLGQGRVDVITTTWTPQGGVALGLCPPEWPVTFTGEYRLSAHDNSDPTGPGRHLVTFAPYYSGRPDLQLGPVIAAEFGLPELQGIDANGNPKSSTRGTAILGQLIMRYIW